MAPQRGRQFGLQRPPPDSLVRAQLDKVLASELFLRSERLSGFLRFVVEEALDGRGGTLKEPVLAHELYGKEADFDGATNPIVRVDARRLRDKLREYYASQPGDPVVIALPKGSYVPTFHRAADKVPAPEIQFKAVEPTSVDVAFREPVPDIDAPMSARSRMSVWRAVMLAMGVAVLLAGGYVALSPNIAPWTASPGRIMLAVLPFQNLTGDPEQEYLCDGLTEEMIATLGRVDPSRLGVIARTSAMHYKHTTKRVDEIGRELGVGYLLESSLRRIGDRVRITAQLIEVRTQGHVWVEQYERGAGDLLSLQREVAATVATRTMVSLGMPARILRSDHQSTNAQAYEHYLRGRYQWAKNTVEGMHKAQDHFRHAIELDPSYARAYSGLADAYAMLGGFHVTPMNESHPLAREAALKALELDDSLGEAHRSLASIIEDHYWDWGEAERHYKRAIELDPNDVTALRFYSFYLASMGRSVEALPIAEQARNLDPVSPVARINLGSVLYLAGQNDAAVRQFEEALDLDANFGFAHSMLGLAYLRKGRPDRAVAHVQKARALSGTRPDVVALGGYAAARAGRRREALATLEDLRQLASPREPSPFLVALVYVGLEDMDHAFEWLEKAIDARSWELPLLKVDPIFETLRADRRFPSLLDRLGLPR